MEIKQIIEKRIKSGYKCPFCRSERVKEVDVVNPSQPIIQPKEMEPDFVPTFSIYCEDCGHIEYFVDRRK